MGVGLGGSGHDSTTMDNPEVATPSIKEEAETSADSMTIDVEGHDEGQENNLSLKAEIDPVENKAWITALRTHVVVPLIR